MSLDYANATIAAAPALAGVFPSGTPAVQPPIAQNALTAANTEMWNGHIGSADHVPGSPLLAAGLGGTPTDGSSLVAAAGTLGRDKAGNLMTWCTSAAPVAAGVTGTIAGTVFTAGAGTAVAQGTTTVANAYLWVKN